MIIDAHAHLETEELDAAGYVRIMDEAGIDKTLLLASLCGPIPKLPTGLIAFFRRLLQSPLQPLGGRIYESLVRNGTLKSGGQTVPLIEEPDNNGVARAIAEYPERFLGFVAINPKLDNAMETLERGIEDQGMVGVKCHAWWHRFDPSHDLLPIARQCEARDLPLLIHLGGGPRTGNFAGLLERCPGLKLILAHVGLPFFQRCWERVKAEKNCFVDASGPYLDGPIVRRAVEALGPDKVLFGSDGPFSLRLPGGGHSYASILQWVGDLPISDRDREKIFHGNLEKLLH